MFVYHDQVSPATPRFLSQVVPEVMVLARVAKSGFVEVGPEHPVAVDLCAYLKTRRHNLFCGRIHIIVLENSARSRIGIVGR
jgi:hypothetical protein